MGIDLQSMSTPALRQYIHENDQRQEEAVLELCCRHDAGDLKEFFDQLMFRPSNVNFFLKRAKQRGIPDATAGLAVGLSEQGVKHRNRRQSPNKVRSEPQTVKKDKPAVPVDSITETQDEHCPECTDEPYYHEIVTLRSGGMTVKDIQKKLGISQRRVGPIANPKDHSDSVFHEEESMFCGGEDNQALKAIKHIDLQLQHLLTPRLYTLGPSDKAKLRKVLSDAQSTLEDL